MYIYSHHVTQLPVVKQTTRYRAQFETNLIFYVEFFIYIWNRTYLYNNVPFYERGIGMCLTIITLLYRKEAYFNNSSHKIPEKVWF